MHAWNHLCAMSWCTGLRQCIYSVMEVVGSGCASAAIADDDHRGSQSFHDGRLLPPRAVYVPLAGTRCHKEVSRPQIYFFCCVLWLQSATSRFIGMQTGN